MTVPIPLPLRRSTRANTATENKAPAATWGERPSPESARLRQRAMKSTLPHARKTTGGAPNQRRRSFVEWFPASALVQTRHESGDPASPTHTSKGKVMACRLVIAFAAATIGMLCIAPTDASAACKFKAKKDFIVIVDVGHSDKDSGQISAHGVKGIRSQSEISGPDFRRTCQRRFCFHADDRDVGSEYSRKPATTIEACQ
jgi:N-acetylmuramoyl-L-alanine amidase